MKKPLNELSSCFNSIKWIVGNQKWQHKREYCWDNARLQGFRKTRLVKLCVQPNYFWFIVTDWNKSIVWAGTKVIHIMIYNWQINSQTCNLVFYNRDYKNTHTHIFKFSTSHKTRAITYDRVILYRPKLYSDLKWSYWLLWKSLPLSNSLCLYIYQPILIWLVVVVYRPWTVVGSTLIHGPKIGNQAAYRQTCNVWLCIILSRLTLSACLFRNERSCLRWIFR